MISVAEFDGEAAADSFASCMGERKFLCEVIRQACYQATSGDSGALHFFSSTTFEQMAMLLGLSATDLRKGVLAKVAAKQINVGKQSSLSAE